MCNRFRNNKNWAAVEREFSATKITLIPPKRAKPNRGVIGDIRPTDPAYVIRPGGVTEILPWGFPSARGPVINFRSEGRRFPLVQRGLVPVAGFYETTPSADPKQKRKDWWLFESDQPMALAAVIRDDRFSLLTVDAGPDVVAIHDRQPVVVPVADWLAWLEDETALVLKPSPGGTLMVRVAEG